MLLRFSLHVCTCSLPNTLTVQWVWFILVRICLQCCWRSNPGSTWSWLSCGTETKICTAIEEWYWVTCCELFYCSIFIWLQLVDKTITPRLGEPVDKVADICLDRSQRSIHKLVDCFLNVDVQHPMNQGHANRTVLNLLNCSGQVSI